MITKQTVPESYETLSLQTKYLAEGHNPIVFFPSGTERIPKLPEKMKSSIRKEGVYFYNPQFITEDLITKSTEKGLGWCLLGFVQNKSEAIKSKNPIAVTVRSENSKEIKTAVVDGSNEDLLKMQAYIFSHWFPNCPVEMTTVFNIIAERLIDAGVIDG